MKAGIVIYPSAKQIFNAFNLAPFDKVKSSLLAKTLITARDRRTGFLFRAKRHYSSSVFGQYFKEIESDLGVKISKTNGNLEGWAKQGVLLLNAILTVRADSPASHRNLGWEKLTDSAIKALSDKKERLVFLLWGKFAQEKKI